jgi:CheY-like chemotaxis protein
LAIIDDNAHTRGMTAESLRLIGAAELICLRSVTDAVEQFRSRAPRAIICEMDLPDIDGITFTRRLREGRMGVHRGTPVILMSRSNTAREVEKARMAGVDEFIARPFSPKTLGDHVEVALSQERPFIDVPSYLGPCPRRRTDLEYSGALRRTNDAQRAAILREALSAELLGQIGTARHANNTVNRSLRVLVEVIGAIVRQLHQLCRKLDDGPMEENDQFACRLLRDPLKSRAVRP